MLADGFHRIDHAAYLADPCERPSLSSSIAHVIDSQSPLHAHAKHPRLGGAASKDTDATDNGSLLHALLLGAGKEIVIVEAADWRTKAAREARDASRANGGLPMLAKEYEQAAAKAVSIRERLREHGVALDGASELTAIWTECTRDGMPVQCRGMLDHLLLDAARPTVYDLKSCRSAHPRACQRHVDAYGYAIQRAAYVSAVEHLRPELAGRVDFVFLFVETEAPFAAFPARLSGEFRELGERKWRRAVEVWERCLRENRWPGYVDGIAEIEPPPWAMKDDLERQVTEAAKGWSDEVPFGA